MDMEKIKKMWEFTISQDDMENGDPQATYKTNLYSSCNEGIETLGDFSGGSLSGSLVNSNATVVSESPSSIFLEQNPISYEKTVEDNSHSQDTFVMAHDSMDAKKSTSVGYRIVKEIARGGMGVVFLGFQESLQREVAIKKMLPSSNRGQQKQKFVAESIVTAYLDHPNIVPVHDLVINDKNEVLLSMKLVKGTAWKQLLYQKEQDKAKKYSLIQHLQILLNVCNAISYAHSKHIVHNDLKPSNIMVGEFGEVLVMDWGIAVDIREKRGDDSHAIHKSSVINPMGTPSYMATELAEGRGRDIGPWTDVYLLGAILYEILMLKPPHSGTPLAAIWEACQGRIPDFSAQIPEELKDICIKSMAKNPEDRYQSANEFSEAIQNFLSHKESLELTEKAHQLYSKSLENINTVRRNILIDVPVMCYSTVTKIIFPYWLFNLKKRWGPSIVFLIFASCVYFLDLFVMKELDVFVVLENLFSAFLWTACWVFGIAVMANLLSLAFKIFRYLFKYDVSQIKVPKKFVIEIYDQMFQAIALYHRAIELWEENLKAKQQKLQVHTKLTEIAINNNEVRLARLQINYLRQLESEEVKKWRKRLHAAEVEQKAENFLSWLSKIVFVAMFIVVVFSIADF